MRRYETDGCVFVVGRNARDNWTMLSQSEPSDMFVHLADSSSCYVIIVPKRRYETTMSDIIYACNLCKQYSKKNKSPIGTTKIIYTDVKNVQKGKQTGEVIIDPSLLNTLTI